jgi:hypothetical protein
MNLRSVVFVLWSVLAPVVVLQGAELVSETPLSRYRAFRMGELLVDVAKQAGIASSEARLISSRPERVEDLDWKITQLSGGSKPDSVREILFRFYNGALFETMVTYDRDQTVGLTDVDMTDALAAIYGPARPPAAKEIAFNSGYNHTVRAIAEWRDTQNVVSLVGLAYGGGFGVVVAATSDQLLARQALLESERLDRAEAPQKALDLRAREVADTQARDEKARLLNKPGFRP